MSTIKSSDEHLTLNADGSSKDIKFQANGVEVGSLSSSGVMTATTFTGSATDSTKLPLAGGTMTGNLLVESSASANTVVRSKGTAADGYRHGFEAVNGHTGGETWSMFSTNNSDGVFSGGKLVFSTGVAGSANASTSKLQITSDGRGLSQFTAKSWVNFNGTGTVAIRDSHNVSSITDNGTGQYRINYSNAMANTSYCPTIGNTADNLGNGDNRWLLNITGISTSYLDVAGVITANGFTYTDKSHCLVTVFGD